MTRVAAALFVVFCFTIYLGGAWWLCCKGERKVRALKIFGHKKCSSVCQYGRAGNKA